MTECYIVLELPKIPKLVVKDGELDATFEPGKARAFINSGQAKILFRECDFSIIDDVRNHMKTIDHFTTYLLIDISPESDFNNDGALLQQAVASLEDVSPDVKIIDSGKNYQFLTFEFN